MGVRVLINNPVNKDKCPDCLEGEERTHLKEKKKE